MREVVRTEKMTVQKRGVPVIVPAFDILECGHRIQLFGRNAPKKGLRERACFDCARGEP